MTLFLFAMDIITSVVQNDTRLFTQEEQILAEDIASLERLW